MRTLGPFRLKCIQVFTSTMPYIRFIQFQRLNVVQAEICNPNQEEEKVLKVKLFAKYGPVVGVLYSKCLVYEIVPFAIYVG